MKYVIDAQTLRGFLQFIALPESGDGMSYPRAEQFRGGATLLQRFIEIVEKAQARIKWADDNFHELPEARHAFEGGEVLHSAGDPLIVAIVRTRKLALLANSHVLVADVNDVGALLKALKAALKKVAE